MEKKIGIVLVFALVGALLLFGCFMPSIQKPAQEGTNCTQSQACFGENFFTCEKAYGNMSVDANNEVYLQIIGTENSKCKVYIQLVRADGLPDFVKGLDAICKVDANELMASGGNIDVAKQDCEGPLYEAMKAASALQGTQN